MSEVIQRQLTCLKFLEEYVASMYTKLSRTLNEGSIILNYIARSSKNHAEVINEIANQLNIELLKDTEYCFELGGAIFKLLRDFNEVLLKAEGSRELAIKVLELMSKEEYLIGEELYMSMVLPAVVSSIDLSESSKDRLIKVLIKVIKDDEEAHARLIKEIISYYKGVGKC